MIITNESYLNYTKYIDFHTNGVDCCYQTSTTFLTYERTKVRAEFGWISAPVTFALEIFAQLKMVLSLLCTGQSKCVNCIQCIAFVDIFARSKLNAIIILQKKEH